MFICAVHKYTDTILRIVFHYTKNNADAEDIAQEVFLSLIKALKDNKKFNDEKHIKAWLIRVAINKSKDIIKSAARRKNVSLDAAANKYCLTKDDFFVIDSINKLKPIERDIIFLHYFEGFSAKEIGGILGNKEDTISTRLKRIRAKLKDILEDS